MFTGSTSLLSVSVVSSKFLSFMSESLISFALLTLPALCKLSRFDVPVMIPLRICCLTKDLNINEIIISYLNLYLTPFQNMAHSHH